MIIHIGTKNEIEGYRFDRDQAIDLIRALESYDHSSPRPNSEVFMIELVIKYIENNAGLIRLLEEKGTSHETI